MKLERADHANSEPASREASLLEGILSEAREEASRMLEEAQKQAATKMSAAEAERKRIIAAAERRSTEQRAAILREAESSAAAEVRRIGLRGREKLINQVMHRFRERMNEFADGDGYPRIVREWIIEAVLGLECDAALIEAARRERTILTNAFLEEIQAALRQMTGREIRLSVARDEEEEENPGIIVYNEARNRAFDNRLEARIRRRRREIMRILRDALDPQEKET